jgi:hypothetical protein
MAFLSSEASSAANAPARCPGGPSIRTAAIRQFEVALACFLPQQRHFQRPALRCRQAFEGPRGNRSQQVSQPYLGMPGIGRDGTAGEHPPAACPGTAQRLTPQG